MRGIAVLSAILGLVFIVPANAKSATTSKPKHDLGTIIRWEKAQIKNQQRIIKERMLWRTLTSESIRMVFLTNTGVKAHRIYLRKLQAKLAKNLKLYNSPLHRIPPHFQEFVCIHGYEGSWPSNTGNGYYGGMQMDLGFQTTYARAYAKTWHVANPLEAMGTADHWPPITQIWVAEEAFKSRGFWPWPNTARFCGLI